MNLASLGLLAGIFFAGALWWRHAVVAAMVLAVFEGAIRKWAFPEAQQWVYLVKDVLLLGAYARFFAGPIVRKERLLDPHPANGPLILLAILATLQLANPALPNLWIGLFGVKAYLVYAPLLYLVPAALREAGEVRRFLNGFVLLAIIPLILGIFQFWMPADSILNRYAWQDEVAPGVATFGMAGKVRITGTFSYISGHTVYLTFIALAALVLVAVERRARTRLALAGVLVLTAANLFMTGSRGPFVALAIGVPVVSALSGLVQVRLSLRRIVRVAMVAAVTMVLATNLFPEAVGALRERVEEGTDIPDRLVGIVREPLWALEEAGLEGFGIGATHQAATYLMQGEEKTAPPAEGEWDRIILEIGPAGLLLVILVRVLLIREAWRARRQAPPGEMRAVLAAALVFLVVNLPGNLVFNHTAHLFYWFLAGLSLIRGAGAPAMGIRSRTSADERSGMALVR